MIRDYCPVLGIDSRGADCWRDDEQGGAYGRAQGGSRSGNHFSIETDPGFHYYLTISDPRFGKEDPYSALLRWGSGTSTPSTPCRQPFEGSGAHS